VLNLWTHSDWASRRARSLAAAFRRALGGDLTDPQKLAVQNAAALVAISEDAQARCLAGDPAVTLDDLERTSRMARAAVRDLGLDRKRREADCGIARKPVLDAGQCRKIAERYAAGETMAELARDYGCGEATIWRALHPAP